MKTLRKTFIAFVSMCLGLACAFAALACSDVMTRGQKGNETWLISARNLDYIDDPDSTLVRYARGKHWQSLTPDGSKGMEWDSVYGIVGVEARSLGAGKLLDGMNEAGLSVAAMWMKSAVFEDIPEGANRTNVLAASDLAAWLLGRFPNVETIKGALELLDVWYDDKVLPHPIHLAIHDAAGKSLVVEWVAGQISVKDDKEYVGVLTNEPDYDQQLENLKSYQGTDASRRKAFSREPLKIMGDPTSESRFVRLYRLKNEALQVVDNWLLFWNPVHGAGWGVQQAMHLMNRVTGVHGTMTHQEKGQDVYPHTVWTVIRDHSNKSYYFRGYRELTYTTALLKTMQFDGAEEVELARADSGETASTLQNADNLPSATRVLKLERLLSLSVHVPVSGEDLGKIGSMYIFARKKNGSTYVWHNHRWLPMPAENNLMASWSGPLNSKTFRVFRMFRNAAPGAWRGVDFYAGYSVGPHDADMFLNGRCALVYSVP